MYGTWHLSFEQRLVLALMRFAIQDAVLIGTLGTMSERRESYG
jgi:hypothetical protein